VLAQPRQIHHERLFELPVNLLLDPFEIIIVAALLELAAEHVLPIAAPLDLVELLAGDQRFRTCGRLGLKLGRRLQPLIFEGVRFVEIVDFRQVRVGEDFRQDPPLGALPRDDLAVFLADPAAFPPLLVLPVLWIADTGLGLDIVEPDVFDAFAVGPDVLAGDRAGMTADALVEVEDHGDLGTNLHFAISLAAARAPLTPEPQSAVPPSTLAASSAALSNQFTWLILRTMTNSSRFAPTVP
jgi:hypothetical protein